MKASLRSDLCTALILLPVSFVYAVGFCWCYQPNDIAFGGITGVAQIIQVFLPAAPVGVVTILLNVPLFLLGWRLLGGKLLLSSLYAMAVTSLAIDVVDHLFTFPPMDPMLAAIFGGVILGATLGVVFPSVVIILLIAAFLQNFAHLPVVIHAFAGVRACVCALILTSVLKLRKTTVVDLPTALIFAAVFLLAAVGNFASFPAETLWGAALNFLLSPVVLVVLAGLAGLCVRAAKGGLRK